MIHLTYYPTFCDFVVSTRIVTGCVFSVVQTNGRVAQERKAMPQNTALVVWSSVTTSYLYIYNTLFMICAKHWCVRKLGRFAGSV